MISRGISKGISRGLSRGITPDGASGVTPLPPLPMTGLAGQWIAGTGITASGSLISQWNDQVGVNNLVQASDALKPLHTTDPLSRPIVRFPLTNVTNGSRSMDVTLDASFATRNLSVWMVCSSPSVNGSAALINATGPSAAMLRNANSKLTTGGVVSDMTMAMPVSVYGAVLSGSGSKVITSYDSFETASLVLSQTGTTLQIGARASGSFAAVDVYEVLYYNATQSDEDWAATKAHLEAKYEIRTTYDDVIVFEGDSITYGVDSTNSQSYPYQLVTDPDLERWLAYALASSGSTVATMTGRVAVRDALFQSGKRNVLAILIGRNDVVSQTALEVYSSGANNLVAYVTAAVAAGWEVWVGTPIAASSSTVNDKLLELSQRIRGTNGYTGITADVGSGTIEIIDYRANAAFDEEADTGSANYSDGTHLTNAGNAIMASILKPYMEEPALP